MREQLNSVGCVPFQTAEESRAAAASDVEWQLSLMQKAQTDGGKFHVQNDDSFRYHMQIAKNDTFGFSVSLLD